MPSPLAPRLSPPPSSGARVADRARGRAGVGVCRLEGERRGGGQRHALRPRGGLWVREGGLRVAGGGGGGSPTTHRGPPPEPRRAQPRRHAGDRDGVSALSGRGRPARAEAS